MHTANDYVQSGTNNSARLDNHSLATNIHATMLKLYNNETKRLLSNKQRKHPECSKIYRCKYMHIMMYERIYLYSYGPRLSTYDDGMHVVYQCPLHSMEFDTVGVSVYVQLP